MLAMTNFNPVRPALGLLSAVAVATLSLAGYLFKNVSE